MNLLGLVTIGQTPRPDLEATFGAAAPHARVVVAGALDGLDEAAIADLARPGEYPLLVRLASGRTVEVPLDRLHPRVTAVASALDAQGATALVIVCTGDFPPVSARAPVILPGRLIPAVVGAVARTRRIGIVTPNAAQAPFAERKWRADGFDPVVTWAPPGARAELERAARELSTADVEMAVLDCMSHGDADKAVFSRIFAGAVVAAPAIVAKVAGAYV